MNDLVDNLAAAHPAGADDANMPGIVPLDLRHERRFPLIIMVDISGSMGLPGSTGTPDIDRVNQMLPKVFAAFATTNPTAPLYMRHIDLSVITYAEQPTVLIDWHRQDQLNSASTPALQGWGGTAMATAFAFALRHIGTRLRYYRTNQIPWGMPNILHFTDGEMNDAKPGDDLWNDLKSRLTTLVQGTTPDKPKASIVHFVPPNGLSSTGPDILHQLTGASTLVDIEGGVDGIDKLVNLITDVGLSISEPYGGPSISDAVSQKIDDGAAGISARKPKGL